MDFLIKGLQRHDADGSGTSSGRLFIEERDVRALYEYLQNGEPFGPGDDRAIPLQIHGERCREEDGTASLRLTVQPDPKYRKKEVQFGAEALAAAFNGEILSAQLV